MVNIDNLPDPVKALCGRIKHDLQHPPVLRCRSAILHQLLNELSTMANKGSATRRVSKEKGDVFMLNDPPVVERKLSTEESDQDYIGRVKNELKEQELVNQSRNMSIMKRSSTAGPPSKLKKQVSFFDPDVEELKHEEKIQENHDAEDSRPIEVQQNLISPILRLGKLSKRTKLKMFKRQPSTEDKEIMIKQRRESADNSSERSDDEENCTDGHHLIYLSETPPSSPFESPDEATPSLSEARGQKYIKSKSSFIRTPVIKRRGDHDQKSFKEKTNSGTSVTTGPRLQLSLTDTIINNQSEDTESLDLEMIKKSKNAIPTSESHDNMCYNLLEEKQEENGDNIETSGVIDDSKF